MRYSETKELVVIVSKSVVRDLGREWIKPCGKELHNLFSVGKICDHIVQKSSVGYNKNNIKRVTYQPGP